MDARPAIHVLGGVSVERDGTVQPVTSGAMQALLVLLVLSPGEPVERDLLVAELWPRHRPPQHPAATIHTRMTRLRDLLGLPRAALSAGSGTYTLHVAPESVDVVAFHRAADTALATTGDPSTTLEAADLALAGWGGRPWPGVDTPALELARRHALTRHQLVVEVRIRALLDLGRVPEALDEVLPLAREHRDAESLQALLVRALHEAGRPRDALEAYLAARRHLLSELGVEPGEELRASYRRLLDDRATPAESRPVARAPTMVGRDDALAVVVDALGGDGRVVVVDGEAGIGKSVLLRAARHAADTAGALVVSGAWDEDGTPMAAWFEALGPPPEAFRASPGPWLRERLARLARDTPVLVALDDAHKADSASLGVLGALARAGVPAGVVVLVAARAPDAVVHLDWDRAFVDLAESPQLVHLPLDELDADSVRSLVALRLPQLATAADAVAELVHHRAGGHPLHVAALLDVLAARPDPGGAAAAVLGVPDRLRAMFTHQLARLPANTRRALEALAVLRPVDLPGLAAVLGYPPLEVAESLRPAVDAGLAVGLADRFVVRHDLMADAVHDAVPAATRAHLHHARLTGLAADADPFVRLRHVLGAATLVDSAAVARARLDAGAAAYQRRALVESLALLDAAAPDLGDDPALAVYRGLVLGGLGRLEEADDVLDGAVDALVPVDLEDDPVRATLVVLAAVGDEPLGKTVAGDPRRLARLHAVESRRLPPEPRFELLAAVVREESLSGTARPDAVVEMRALAARPGAAATTSARARALEARQLVEGRVWAGHRLAVASDAFALAEETDDPLLRLDATELLMTAALAAGRVEQARKLRTEMASDARRWHRPRLIWAAHLVESALLLAEGDVDAADTAALAGLHRGQELGLTDAVQAYGVHLMIRHWLGGTVETLGDLPAQAAVNAPRIPAWSAAAAVAAARRRELDEARWHLAEFRRKRATITGRSFDRPALCMAAAAGFALGDREAAELVLAELPADPEAVVLVGFGAVVVGPATLFTGLASWTLGDVDAARVAFRQAADLVGPLGWRPWSDAARRCEKALDDPDAEDLPLGLISGRSRT